MTLLAILLGVAGVCCESAGNSGPVRVVCKHNDTRGAGPMQADI